MKWVFFFSSVFSLTILVGSGVQYVYHASFFGQKSINKSGSLGLLLRIKSFSVGWMDVVRRVTFLFFRDLQDFPTWNLKLFVFFICLFFGFLVFRFYPFFFYHFLANPRANFEPIAMKQSHSPYVNHFVAQFQVRGHWESCCKVRFLSLAKHHPLNPNAML